MNRHKAILLAFAALLAGTFDAGAGPAPPINYYIFAPCTHFKVIII
jgi:hypothetical protein